ncbi:MAG: hypothetical protein IH918_04280 [Acidobacteria bacterium]|nr:hypothetical protein [Acidobacteriota bacterium]
MTFLVVAAVESDEEVQTPAQDPSSLGEPEAVTEVVDEEVDPDESWWEEPDDEASETDAEEVVPSEEMPVAETDDIADDEKPEVKSTSIFGSFAPGASKEPAAVFKEELSEVPTVGEDDEDGEVEEDTEAFLEKVFSELDSSNDEEEEGYGLLRRRRMGVMRDSSRDT